MLCDNFPNLGRQVTLGRLPSSGCLALDGTPYEAYTLTTDGAGTLTVTGQHGFYAADRGALDRRAGTPCRRPAR